MKNTLKILPKVIEDSILEIDATLDKIYLNELTELQVHKDLENLLESLEHVKFLILGIKKDEK